MGKAVFTVVLKAMFWKFGLFRKKKPELFGWKINVLLSDHSRASTVIHEHAGTQSFEMK